MDNENFVLLEGYLFTFKGCCRSNSKTTIVVGLKGDGSAASAMTGWIMEVCQAGDAANELNIVSCEKRKGNGAWAPAAAQNTTYELTGDIDISGIIIEERVSNLEEDPETEFRIIFDQELNYSGVRLAYISGEDIFCSDKVLSPEPPEIYWLTPIEKTFCLYFVVSDGYRPEGTCKINVSVTKRGACLIHDKGTFSISDGANSFTKAVKTDILGNVKVFASIPLKNSQACGDIVETSTCDCFELNETICYSDESNIDIKDVSVYPVRKSYDLTLLNARCGKSVYRLDGEYIIDCRACE